MSRAPDELAVLINSISTQSSDDSIVDSIASKRRIPTKMRADDGTGRDMADDISQVSQYSHTRSVTSHSKRSHHMTSPLFDRLSHRDSSRRDHPMNEIIGVTRSTKRQEQEIPTYFELPTAQRRDGEAPTIPTFGRQAMRTSLGTRPVTSAVQGFAGPENQHHLQTDAAHIIRLSPIGKTYVQYNVRSRPFVSRISEVLPSRAEIEKLRSKASSADVLMEQLKEARGHLLQFQRAEEKRQRAEAIRREQEQFGEDVGDPLLKGKTHKELISMVTELESKLVHARFKFAFKGSQQDGASADQEEGTTTDRQQAITHDEGCPNCKKLREILSKTRHDVIDFRKEAKENLERALAAESALKKGRTEKANEDHGPSVITEDRACQADIELLVEAGEEEEEEESLEELLKRNKKMNPLSRYIKKGKPKMTIEGCLDIVNDVYDKKTMVDAVELSQGNTSGTLAEFLDDYFLHKFGLQKLATKKVGEFVNALLFYKSSQRRFGPFLRLCGLVDIRLYNRFLGEYEMRMIMRIFGEIPEGAKHPPPEKIKGVYEKLKNSPTLIPTHLIVPAILGARARLDDPTSWDCPQLMAVATTKQIRNMVNKALAELKVITDTKSVMKCVDVDDLIDLTLDFLMSCYAIAQERLELMFHLQDKDESGSLEYEEFAAIVNEDLANEVDSRAILKAWKTMVSMAGRAGEGEDGGLIYNSAIFSVAACQCGLLPVPSEAPVFPAYERSNKEGSDDVDEDENDSDDEVKLF